MFTVRLIKKIDKAECKMTLSCDSYKIYKFDDDHPDIELFNMLGHQSKTFCVDGESTEACFIENLSGKTIDKILPNK